MDRAGFSRNTLLHILQNRSGLKKGERVMVLNIDMGGEFMDLYSNWRICSLSAKGICNFIDKHQGKIFEISGVSESGIKLAGSEKPGTNIPFFLVKRV